MRTRRTAPLGALFLLLFLASGCGDDGDCRCTATCGGDVVYCAQAPDGAFVCHGSIEEFPWYQPGTTPPGKDEDTVSHPAEEVVQPPIADTAEEETAVQDLSPDDALPDEQEPPEADTTIPEEEILPWAGEGELRGIWVTRWDYNSAADVAKILKNVADWGFNTVFFQVRGNADAYYLSQVEPWAKGLTGTLGKDPGWNPLAVAIDEAHARGLEIHAWINTFPAWTGTTPPEASDPPHILYAHPEWRVVDSSGQYMAFNNSYTFVSPGIPGVRAHIKAVVVDIAKNYPVDGIHFDYIRYPGPQFSHDTWTLEAFEAAKAEDPGLIWGNFQREILSSLVGEAYDAITAVRPEAKVTASVWGIYKDEFGWGGTSEGYFDYYQDSHGWLQSGYLDAICPMVYWPLTTPKGGWTDFATLADHHLSAMGNRHVYVGLKSDYPSFSEVQNEIEYLRTLPTPGFVVFAYSTTLSNGFGPQFKATVNAEPTTLPPTPWKF
jgi:uncharacterized lipoprotein YddW (UPF0748 family)